MHIVPFLKICLWLHPFDANMIYTGTKGGTCHAKIPKPWSICTTSWHRDYVSKYINPYVLCATRILVHGSWFTEGRLPPTGYVATYLYMMQLGDPSDRSSKQKWTFILPYMINHLLSLTLTRVWTLFFIMSMRLCTTIKSPSQYYWWCRCNNPIVRII